MGDAGGFFESLLEAVGDHPALRHPFLETFARGADREQMKRFAIEHYAYSRMFIRNLAAVLANTPDENARRLLALNIYEEIGEPPRPRDMAHVLLLDAGLVSGEQLARAMEHQARSPGSLDVVALLIEDGVVTRAAVAEVVERHTHAGAEMTHTALFRRFMKAVGISAQAADEAPLPATLAFVAEARAICRDEPWLVGLGALGPGTECVVPRLYSRILSGLQTSAHLRPEDYVFWTLHVHCDDAHGKNIIDAMRPHATSAAAQHEIRDGALRILSARSAWMDALHEHVFG